MFTLNNSTALLTQSELFEEINELEEINIFSIPNDFLLIPM